MLSPDETPTPGAHPRAETSAAEPRCCHQHPAPHAPAVQEQSDLVRWMLQGWALLTHRKAPSKMSAPGGSRPRLSWSRPRLSFSWSWPQLSKEQLRPRLTPFTVVMVLGVAGFFLLPADLLYAGSTSMAAGLVGLGLFLPLAWLRELSLNGAGLAGLAAYLFAYYGGGIGQNAAQGGLGDHLLGILIALGSVIFISLLGGLASLVVTGLYFVVATLVIQVGIEKVIFSVPVLTGGASGRSVWHPAFEGWFDTQRFTYLVAGAVVLVLAFLVSRLMRSRPSFHAILVGHQPQGAMSTGLRNWMVKLGVFAASGLLIGLAGLLYAFINGTPPPPFSFSIIYAVIFIAIPIASGMRDLSSVFLTAAAFTCIPIALEPLNIPPNFLSGVILLSALLVGKERDRLTSWVRGLARRQSTAGTLAAELMGAPVTADGAQRQNGAAAAASAVRGGEGFTTLARVAPLARSASEAQGALVGRDIVVDFGGVRAVDGAQVLVDRGDRVGIIGANGAGKTTLFNALTGYVPMQGTVTLGGDDITRWPAFIRARAGLRRTFQQPRLVDLLTVEQNIICGHGSEAEYGDRSRWLLDRFGLSALAAVPVAALPFGVRREVEVIRALSRPPRILMLDEPVSGLEDEEADRLAEILIELQESEGWGLMVIEHDLRFVTRVAQSLIVMENGQQLTQGRVQEVMHQEAVRRVYLGELVTV